MAGDNESSPRDALDRKRILLVEGPDDRMVISRFSQRHSIAGEFAVKDVGGYPEVRKTLKAILKFEDDEKRKERIGVVVDADERPRERWQSICEVLRGYGYHPPKEPDNRGVVLSDEERPIVGIWMMPDNSIAGKLEHVVAFLVHPEDSVWAHGLDSIRGLPERRFREIDEAKARIHTWLAWQDEPGIQMSQAITKGLLSYETEATQNFIAWLNRVFGP